MCTWHVSTLQWFLNAYNVVFLISGLVLAFLGVSELRALEHSTRVHVVATYLLIAAAGLVIFISLLGCFSIWRLHRGTLAWYGGFLVMILFLEAACGMLCFFSYGFVKAELRAEFRSLFLELYGKDNSASRRVNLIQRSLKCCGIDGFEDWGNSEWRREKSVSYMNRVPTSCCKTWDPFCGKWDIPNNIHYDGCVEVIARGIERNLSYIAGLGAGILVIQLLGLVITYALHVRLKNYEVASYSAYSASRHNYHFYEYS